MPERVPVCQPSEENKECNTYRQICNPIPIRRRDRCMSGRLVCAIDGDPSAPDCGWRHKLGVRRPSKDRNARRQHIWIKSVRRVACLVPNRKRWSKSDLNVPTCTSKIEFSDQPCDVEDRLWAQAVCLFSATNPAQRRERGRSIA